MAAGHATAATRSPPPTMSSRGPPPPSTPTTPGGSKLSKLLHKTRDRSRSETASPAPPPEPSPTPSASSSRFSPTAPIAIPDAARRHDDDDSFDSLGAIEPAARARVPRAERAQPSLSLYGSPPSGAKIAELPTRLSGWFTHAFGGSANDLTLPSILAQSAASASASSPASPRARVAPAALLAAAKQGRGHLDKAMRYLLDSDATPDNATEPIWLLGVQHSPAAPPPASPDTPDFKRSRSKLRGGSADSLALPQPLAHAAAVAGTPKHPGTHWPREFYADFASRVWCTYRSQFQPIRDSALSALEAEIGAAAQSSSPTRRNWWGGEKGWTSDAGWGCMLRTGQSLLANALLHLHLGRDWRVPAYPEATPAFATYVRLLTWFLDTPAPAAPFSVHRMALAGKELGKDVGQWFGPSTAAGAIQTLVGMFPAAGLGVAVARDGTLYQSDVFAASHGPAGRTRAKVWGERAVLVLVGLRLGLDGVNPIYYETIKILYTFPQSVGIAGGRPSSSYYFVGAQADNLFYLDPHHARPAIPLRAPPTSPSTSSFDARPALADDEPGTKKRRKGSGSLGGRGSPLGSARSSTSTGSGSGRSAFARHTASPMGPSFSAGTSPPGHGRWATDSPGGSLRAGSESPAPLTPEQAHYAHAYSAAELRTFHCERVRKMPLSGLDPSMLLGFLCRDERDWLDLRARIADLKKAHKPIFSIADEPPAWSASSDGDSVGLESFSDPDEAADEDDEVGDDDELFADARSASVRSPSTSPDPEDDPRTPGPGKTFALGALPPPDEGDIEDDWEVPGVPTPDRAPSPPLRVPSSPPIERQSSAGSTQSFRSAQEPSYPFPSSPPTGRDEDEDPAEAGGRERRETETQDGHDRRARRRLARDGGRTASGGVRAQM